MKILFFLGSILIPSINCFALVDGVPLSERDIQVFGSFVTVGEDRNISGGVHIGDGLILTANHVFEPIHREITVRDINGKTIGTFSFNRSKQVLAPRPLYSVDAGIEVEVPDLAILVPEESVRKKLKRLPVANLGGRVGGDRPLWVVGVGQIDFNKTPNPDFAIPRIGKFEFERDNSIDPVNLFVSTHHAQKGLSAACPGDSGSPIWSVEESGNAIVVGITMMSELPQFGNQGELVGKAKTYFTDINTSEVKGWFSDLSKGPLKNFKKMATVKDMN